MPHKRKRQRTANEDDLFNLPPSLRAAPLPVEKKGKDAPQDHKSVKRKRKARLLDGYGEDDTPAAFRRLMAISKGQFKPRSGLDSGNNKKKGKATTDGTEQQENQIEGKDLKILPGESLASFGARVDGSMPLSQNLVPKEKGKDPLGLPRKQNRLEKRMQKMQADWRIEEAKRKEEAEAAAEEYAERYLEHVPVSEQLTSLKKQRKGKNGASSEIDDDNPWEKLRDKRPAQSHLHDVAQAPPELKKLSQKKMLRLGAEVQVTDVPKQSGSLRRREELGKERDNIVEAYRRLMAQKSGER